MIITTWSLARTHKKQEAQLSQRELTMCYVNWNLCYMLYICTKNDILEGARYLKDLEASSPTSSLLGQTSSQSPVNTSKSQVSCKSQNSNSSRVTKSDSFNWVPTSVTMMHGARWYTHCPSLTPKWPAARPSLCKKHAFKQKCLQLASERTVVHNSWSSVGSSFHTTTAKCGI